jgi:hypothetical protein
MIRLTDEQWERIRSHFPEEHIADGRPGRKPIPLWLHEIKHDGFRIIARKDGDRVRLYSHPGNDVTRPLPADCRGADPNHISTTFADRQNLNVRMHTRRFTRLTNAFSKKIENHAHAVALFALYYNFVRVHKTLRMTPAMAASVTKRLWEISDVVDMLEAWENTT